MDDVRVCLQEARFERGGWGGAGGRKVGFFACCRCCCCRLQLITFRLTVLFLKLRGASFSDHRGHGRVGSGTTLPCGVVARSGDFASRRFSELRILPVAGSHREDPVRRAGWMAGWPCGGG